MTVWGPGAREGQVYFLERLSDGAIKIGWTSREPEDRRYYESRYWNEAVEILATFPAKRHVEWDLHKQFAEYRIDGGWGAPREWFRPNEALLERIELVKLLHEGNPA